MQVRKFDLEELRAKIFDEVVRVGECSVETPTASYILKPEIAERLKRLSEAIDSLDYSKITREREECRKCSEEREVLIFKLIELIKKGKCLEAGLLLDRIPEPEIRRKGCEECTSTARRELKKIVDLCHRLRFSDFSVRLSIEAVSKKLPENYEVAERYRTKLGEIRILYSNGRYYYDPSLGSEDLAPREKSIFSMLVAKVASGVTDYREMLSHLCRKYGGDEARLSKIASTYFEGLGSLQYFIEDKRLTDVYVTQRGEISVEHYDYGFMNSTVRPTIRELHNIAHGLRMVSGLPFDDSHPTLQFFWEEKNCRISASGYTANYTGNPEYAVRIWPEKPWSVIDLIKRRSLSVEAAALVTLLVNMGCGCIIAGDRGAGKSTFMQALLLTIPSFSRKVCLMTAREIHKWFYEKDFNLSEFRVHTGDEVTVEGIPIAQAVKQMLIHGESRFVLFNEIKFREEAVPFFTVAAAAGVSSILTTMHANDAPSVITRLMIDFGLPLEALRNIDLIITLRSFRYRETMKRRALLAVTEILPFREDPVREERLLDILSFDPGEWRWRVLDTQSLVRISKFVRSRLKSTGMSVESLDAMRVCIEEIYRRLVRGNAGPEEVRRSMDAFFLSFDPDLDREENLRILRRLEGGNPG